MSYYNSDGVLYMDLNADRYEIGEAVSRYFGELAWLLGLHADSDLDLGDLGDEIVELATKHGSYKVKADFGYYRIFLSSSTDDVVNNPNYVAVVHNYNF